MAVDNYNTRILVTNPQGAEALEATSRELHAGSGFGALGWVAANQTIAHALLGHPNGSRYVADFLPAASSGEEQDPPTGERLEVYAADIEQWPTVLARAFPDSIHARPAHTGGPLRRVSRALIRRIPDMVTDVAANIPYTLPINLRGGIVMGSNYQQLDGGRRFVIGGLDHTELLDEHLSAVDYPRESRLLMAGLALIHASEAATDASPVSDSMSIHPTQAIDA